MPIRKITIRTDRTAEEKLVDFHLRQDGTWGMVSQEDQVDWYGRWMLDYADTLKTVGATVRFIRLSGLLSDRIPPDYLQIHESQEGGDQPSSLISIFARWSGNDIPSYIITGEITEIVKDKDKEAE